MSPSQERLAFVGLAADHPRRLLNVKGGLLRADKYHRRNVCQDSIAAHDLSEGEFNSILAGVDEDTQRE